MVKSALWVALLLSALAGCSRSNVESQEAVKRGVVRDISKNVNIDAMDVNVVSVVFRDKEADAVVSFAPKGGSASQGMTMSYTLARQGDDWHIVKRAQADVQRHAGQSAAPQLDPQQLPPGHPK
ncbi:MAG: hypothetical protein ABJC09_11090 [Terriglobia bacterium]